jgi:XTP/dITP diphosphohydrolase
LELLARLASRNAHKLEELRAALSGWTIELLDVDSYPPEVGETHYANARAKAIFGRGAAPPGEWVLGEDSGLAVDALGGRPGLRSARWAGDDDPLDRLLAELDGLVDRSAHYVCELVAIAPDGAELHVTGRLDGRITDERRGSEGFGYDPVFVPSGEERTVAELGDAWKRENSHRARAARALAERIRRGPRPPRDPGRGASPASATS